MLGNHGRSITRRVFAPPTRLFAKAGITPNQVTVTKTLLSVGIVISALPFGYVWQGALAFALVLFVDPVGGILARVTSGGTRFGAFLDSALDHIADGTVFASLAARTAFSFPEGLPRTLATRFGLAAIIGTGTVPYARARAEFIGIETKPGVVERTGRLLITVLSAVFIDFGWGVWWLVIGLGWVAFAPFTTAIQRIVFTAKTVKEETRA